MGAVPSKPEDPFGGGSYMDPAFVVDRVSIMSTSSSSAKAIAANNSVAQASVRNSGVLAISQQPNEHVDVLTHLVTPLCQVLLSPDHRNVLTTSNDFVQDPQDPSCFLVRVPLPVDATCLALFGIQLADSLTGGALITASSPKELHNFITNEFFHDPNIHTRSNVAFLGDFGPGRLEFVWELSQQLGKGPLYCCFVEYDKRADSLRTLAQFKFFADAEPAQTASKLAISPQGSSPSTNLTTPPSDYSAVSASPGSPTSPLRPPKTSLFDASSPLKLAEPMSLTQALSQTDAVKGLGQSVDALLEKSISPADVPIQNGDDGPVFRATIQSLEKKTRSLKALIKRLYKQAVVVSERQAELAAEYTLYLDYMKDIDGIQVAAGATCEQWLQIAAWLNSSNMDLQQLVLTPLKKFYETEIKMFDGHKKDFDDESREYYSWLSRYLGQKSPPKASKSDSKYQDKRKAFELKRFDYFTYLTDLHGGRKLQALTLSISQNEEKQLARFLSLSAGIQASRPKIDRLVDHVKQAAKDWTRSRTEVEIRRRQLERSIEAGDSTLGGGAPNTQAASLSAVMTNSNNIGAPVSAGGPSAANLSSNPIPIPTPMSGPGGPTRSRSQGANRAIPRLNTSLGGMQGARSAIPSLPALPNLTPSTSASNGASTAQNIKSLIIDSPPKPSKRHSYIEDVSDHLNLQQQQHSFEELSPDSAEHKEGLLWSMDPSTKNINKKTVGWHKYWVVLAGGRLSEYSNWKQGLEANRVPIDLKMALCREARNSDRRFCFEIVTPQTKRTYQATSEDDLATWVAAINGAISTSLENVSSPPRESPAQLAQRELSRSPLKDNGGHLRRVVSSGAGTAIPGSAPAPPMSQAPPQMGAISPDVYKLALSIDASNGTCADCASTQGVTWISLNLMVIICTQCSAVHRSLGSHVTKVRSLTLDTRDFTPAVVDAIRQTCNRTLNDIYEAKLSDKSTLIKNREHFIQNKYVSRKYAAPLNGNQALIDAIVGHSVLELLRAIFAGADVNLPVNDGLLIYSLRANPVHFAIPELLLLNGTKVPSIELSGKVSLSEEAKRYLLQKVERANE
ncbi:Protein csx2 [Yarrowia sp. B02]|nr:Protein csx2 [Yarrowia sp. B02]